MELGALESNFSAWDAEVGLKHSGELIYTAVSPLIMELDALESNFSAWDAEVGLKNP